MPLIVWEDKFELGIEEIDKQHQKMVAIINKLYDLFENKKHKDVDEIGNIITEMIDYADYHFKTEEKYFQLFSYEKMKSHIEIHDQYRARIKEWRERYDSNKHESVFFEISNFLQNWWIWHINNTDREYVPLLKANKVK